MKKFNWMHFKDLTILEKTYWNNRKSLWIMNSEGERVGVATVNLNDARLTDGDCFIPQHYYSEDNLLEILSVSGIVRNTGITHVTPQGEIVYECIFVRR